MTTKNEQIDVFLEYYYALPMAPQYAVLVRGNWGSGKTWFIKRSLEKFKAANGRVVYVSLYGISSTKGIEDEFFQQLHPVLASKGMAIAGKVVKGLLKGSLKIDLDGDGKDDGTATIGIPDLDLQKYMQNTEGMILVFDDVERCSIPIGDLLGYINYFVEHRGYKAILVANEEEILARGEKDSGEGSAYRRIKEKLIGKTFEVEANLQAAIDSFVLDMDAGEAKDAVSRNESLIRDLYEASNYQNLRHLRQALLDFGRIVGWLREARRKHEGMLQDLLSTFLIYSFEIKSGNLTPKGIRGIRSDYYSVLAGGQANGSSEFLRLRSKYIGFTPLDTLLPDELWIERMETGLVDPVDLERAITQSKYFPQEQPEWIRLWNASLLTDDEIDRLLVIVQTKFDANEYIDPGVLRHVVGILLRLSSLGICHKSNNEILKQAIANVDALKESGVLANLTMDVMGDANFGYAGLGFSSSDSAEFIALTKYIKSATKEALELSYPVKADELLQLMEVDATAFARKLIVNNSKDNLYFNVPILAHMDAASFVAQILKLDPSAVYHVSAALKERYTSPNFLSELYQEREWLGRVADMLSTESNLRKGKMSSHMLSQLRRTIADSARILGDLKSDSNASVSNALPTSAGMH